MGIYVRGMDGTTPIGTILLGELAARVRSGAALVVFGATTTDVVGAIGLSRGREPQ